MLVMNDSIYADGAMELSDWLGRLVNVTVQGMLL